MVVPEVNLFPHEPNAQEVETFFADGVLHRIEVIEEGRLRCRVCGLEGPSVILLSEQPCTKPA